MTPEGKILAGAILLGSWVQGCLVQMILLYVGACAGLHWWKKTRAAEAYACEAISKTLTCRKCGRRVRPELHAHGYARYGCSCGHAWRNRW